MLDLDGGQTARFEDDLGEELNAALLFCQAAKVMKMYSRHLQMRVGEKYRARVN